MTLAAIGPGSAVIGRGIGAILLYAVLGVLLMLLGFCADRPHHARQAQPAWSARARRTPCWSRPRAWSSMAFIVVRVDLQLDRHAASRACSAR